MDKYFVTTIFALNPGTPSTAKTPSNNLGKYFEASTIGGGENVLVGFQDIY
jgi:hypothetical protein